ncbi:MAG TPA: response regulator [Cyclobacteriaceae bacterium]|jgi:hypothetical protein
MEKRILVVDDSSVMQNLVKKIFAQLDYEVVSAKNGNEALEKLKKQDFNVILMDINMPVMDGMECTKQIRKLKNKKGQLPIIAITGNSKNYAWDDFKKAGMSKYLQKPLNFDELVEIVNSYVKDDNKV